MSQVSLSEKLVIAISSRALFNLEKEHQVFEKEGLEAYYSYIKATQSLPLKPGSGFKFISSLLRLNNLCGAKVVEVILLSKNSAMFSLHISMAIQSYKLDITRHGWTNGGNIADYLKALRVDLFLSRDAQDVKDALNNGIAAAQLLHKKGSYEIQHATSEHICIAFDGDAVVFDASSETVYKKKGLQAFVEYELQQKAQPLGEGPLITFLKALVKLKKKLNTQKIIIKTALITARSAPTHERVIRTLNLWGIDIDTVFFLGGYDKSKILEVFGADIFFDDQDCHLDLAAKKVPSAKVITDLETKN